MLEQNSNNPSLNPNEIKYLPEKGIDDLLADIESSLIVNHKAEINLSPDDFKDLAKKVPEWLEVKGKEKIKLGDVEINFEDGEGEETPHAKIKLKTSGITVSATLKNSPTPGQIETSDVDAGMFFTSKARDQISGPKLDEKFKNLFKGILGEGRENTQMGLELTKDKKIRLTFKSPDSTETLLDEIPGSVNPEEPTKEVEVTGDSISSIYNQENSKTEPDPILNPEKPETEFDPDKNVENLETIEVKDIPNFPEQQSEADYLRGEMTKFTNAENRINETPSNPDDLFMNSSEVIEMIEMKRIKDVFKKRFGVEGLFSRAFVNLNLTEDEFKNNEFVSKLVFKKYFNLLDETTKVSDLAMKYFSSEEPIDTSAICEVYQEISEILKSGGKEPIMTEDEFVANFVSGGKVETVGQSASSGETLVSEITPSEEVMQEVKTFTIPETQENPLKDETKDVPLAEKRVETASIDEVDSSQKVIPPSKDMDITPDDLDQEMVTNDVVLNKEPKEKTVVDEVYENFEHTRTNLQEALHDLKRAEKIQKEGSTRRAGAWNVKPDWEKIQNYKSLLDYAILESEPALRDVNSFLEAKIKDFGIKLDDPDYEEFKKLGIKVFEVYSRTPKNQEGERMEEGRVEAAQHMQEYADVIAARFNIFRKLEEKYTEKPMQKESVSKSNPPTQTLESRVSLNQESSEENHETNRQEEEPIMKSIRYFLQEKNPLMRKVVKESRVYRGKEQTSYSFYRFRNINKDGVEFAILYSFTLLSVGDETKGRKSKVMNHSTKTIKDTSNLQGELTHHLDALKSKYKWESYEILNDFPPELEGILKKPDNLEIIRPKKNKEPRK